MSPNEQKTDPENLSEEQRATAPSDLAEVQEAEDPRSRRYKARNDKTMPLPGQPGNLQALEQAPEQKPDPNAPPTPPKVPPAEGDLIGSDTHAAVYVREDGEEVQLGAIVQDAFKESGDESVAAWNQRSQTERDEAIDAIIEEQGLTPKEDEESEGDADPDAEEEEIDADEQESDPDEDFEDDDETAEENEAGKTE